MATWYFKLTPHLQEMRYWLSCHCTIPKLAEGRQTLLCPLQRVTTCLQYLKWSPRNWFQRSLDILGSVVDTSLINPMMMPDQNTREQSLLIHHHSFHPHADHHQDLKFLLKSKM